jgi:hypothetical protein
LPGREWGKVIPSSAERIQRNCRTDTFDFFGRRHFRVFPY